MSALEVFVRIRQFKARAAEYFELAAQPESEEVRARYLAIADHYMALAEAELRADRLGRRKRLDRMRKERARSRRADETSDADAGPKADDPPSRPPRPAKLRVIEGAKRVPQRGTAGPAQMVAQAEFVIVKSAP